MTQRPSRRIHEGTKFTRRLAGMPMAEGTDEPLRRFRLMQERRGLMASTIHTRRSRLLLLAAWLDPRSLLEAEREDIEEFLDERDLAARERYDYISNLGMFYKAMIEDGRTDTDPTAFIHRPRMRMGLPRPISDGDLDYALAQAPPVIAAALTLAAYEGLRAKEIAQLTREDVLDTNVPPGLHVRFGKGDRDHVLPLHPEVMPALRRPPLATAGASRGRVAGRTRPTECRRW